MNKSRILSAAAALSLAVGSVASADMAIAQERTTEAASETNELDGGSAIIAIGALVAVVLGIVIASGGGDDDDRPVSP